VYLYATGGSSLFFTNSSVGTLPTLENNCSQVIELFTPITIATNLTVSTIATGGGGHIKFNGGITGTGDITLLCNGKLITFNAAAPINNTGFIINSGSGSELVTISGAISNNVTAVVQNSATSSLILSGGNTFAGGLYIKAGTVSLGNANAAGTGTIYLGDAATGTNVTLAIANNTLTGITNLVSVVSGNVGSATIQFTPTSGTGYINGLIMLNRHDLIVANTSAQNSQVKGGISGIGNLTFAETGGLVQVNNGVIDITGNIIINNSGTPGTQLFGYINNTGAITNISSSSGDVTISGAIGPNVTAVVQNSPTSTMILSGTNAFSGGVQHVAGKLNINSATALGTGPFTISGGTTNDCTAAADVIMTANNAQNWNGDFTFTGTKSLNLGSGSVAMSGSRQVTVSAKTLTVGGSISGIDFGLTKLGAGTLVLSGVNTYSGGTVVNAGTVTVTRAESLPGYATPGNVTVSGGTLITPVGAAGSWSQSQIDALRAANSFTNGIDISNGNFDYTATSDITFASITRGAGGSLRLIQDQPGRVSVTSALSNLNSAAGILPWAILKTGSTFDLAVGGLAGAPITAFTNYEKGGETTWTANTINARPTNSVVMTTARIIGSLVLDNGINVTGGKNILNTSNGFILQTGGSSLLSPLFNSNTFYVPMIDTEGDLTLTGVGNNSCWNPGDVVKAGPGKLFLGAVDSFLSAQAAINGNFYINQGLVEYSRVDNAVWTRVAGKAYIFNGGNFTYHGTNTSDSGNNLNLTFNADATFTIDNRLTGSNTGAGQKIMFGSVSSDAHSVTFKPVTVTITGGAHVNSGTAGLVLGTTNTAIHTVTLNGTPTLNVTNPTAGGTTELTLNGVIGDGGLGYGITKTGNGLLTLSGTNTYTGTNAVNVGTLRITQASCLSTNSSVSIAAGALMNLDFSGTNTVKALTLGTSPMSPGVYGVGKKGSFYFSGNGALNVTTGPSSPNGTMIRFF
jgi:autotransporter-associated beta strand protein